MLDTIEQVQDFCKLIKVKPSKVYIHKDEDGDGSYIRVNFNSAKHSQRYKKEVTKYFNKLNYKDNPDLIDEQELDNIYEEMQATRH